MGRSRAWIGNLCPGSYEHSEKLDGSQPSKRLLFLDNLRWTVIVLVLSMHAADTYGPLGSWYFVDRQPLSAPTLLFFVAWQTYLQAFFMGLLFFIAGFFIPDSFDRKGLGRFLRDRAFRLGWPVLLYMFVIGPLTEYYAAHSWTSTTPTSFGREWLKHIRNGQFLQESGPLWFCLALLIFSVAYAAYRVLCGRTRIDRAHAHKADFRVLVSFALVMAAVTFLIRLAEPASFLNLPVKDFGQYIFLFSAGIFAAPRYSLIELPLRSGKSVFVTALTIGFGAWLLLLIAGGGFAGARLSFLGRMALAECSIQRMGIVYLRYFLLRPTSTFR